MLYILRGGYISQGEGVARSRPLRVIAHDVRSFTPWAGISSSFTGRPHSRRGARVTLALALIQTLSLAIALILTLTLTLALTFALTLTLTLTLTLSKAARPWA